MILQGVINHMKQFLFIALLLFSNCSTSALKKGNNASYNKTDFLYWIKSFKDEAEKKHSISKDTLDLAFENIKYNPKVINADNYQPEFNKTFYKYMDSALSKKRIKIGKFMMQNYKTLLKNVYDKYKIPPEIIVSFWGLETLYGEIKGNYDLIEALTTLAYNSRRSEFFKKELIHALKIIDKKDMTISQLYGSWAGAFGNFQFMPSTFNTYAIDGNNDGFKNITGDIVDAMHSAGNYLKKMGWDSSVTWGTPVIVSKSNTKAWEYINSNKWESAKFFASLGVNIPKNKIVDKNKSLATLIAPIGSDGVIFMVYKNFKYIMNWNASTNYALSVCLLSDAIKYNNKGAIYRPSNWKNIHSLSHKQINQIQTRLKELKFYDANPTGFYGKITAISIKKYQKFLKQNNKKYKTGRDIIEDGYPSIDVYKELFEK